MSTMIVPPSLHPGDKIAAISLSWGGPGMLPHRYEAGKRQMQAEFGVTVVETPNALRAAEWLHANPRARADDLMGAFADPSIKAIFSTIGGDDSIRILPYLDLDLIAANPKVFVGMSDTTVTHMACFKAGLSTCYGPGIMQAFAENGGMFPYVAESVRRTLFSTEPIGEIQPDANGWTVEFLDWAIPENQGTRRKLNRAEGWTWIQGNGIHRGPLLGGCIEVLDWLRGTDVWPDREKWKGALLFLETSEEAVPPTTVLRILRTFGAMGILQQASGLLFGRPGGHVPVDQFDDYDAALLKALDEFGLTDFPVVSRMDFGHTDPVFLLPYGVEAQIDCDQHRFSIPAPAVAERLPGV
jgi:muramoyltetrapeptide carboxypeptidase LdcA involved in peptidoglycan recycling